MHLFLFFLGFRSFRFGFNYRCLNIFVFVVPSWKISDDMNPVHAHQIPDRNFNLCLQPWRVSSKVLLITTAKLFSCLDAARDERRLFYSLLVPEDLKQRWSP
ncbi:hypothetical protein LXL04_022536, partial [Taraxacum kok-saghyz]